MNGKQDALRKKINWTGRISAGLTWSLLMVIIVLVLITYNQIRELAEYNNQNIRCAVQVFTSGNRDVTVKDYDKCVLESRHPSPVSTPSTPTGSTGSSKADIFTPGAFQPIEPIAIPPASQPSQTQTPAAAPPVPQTQKPEEPVPVEPKPPVAKDATPVLDIETRINPVTGLPEFRVKGDRFWQVQ